MKRKRRPDQFELPKAEEVFNLHGEHLPALPPPACDTNDTEEEESEACEDQAWLGFDS